MSKPFQVIATPMFKTTIKFYYLSIYRVDEEVNKVVLIAVMNSRQSIEQLLYETMLVLYKMKKPASTIMRRSGLLNLGASFKERFIPLPHESFLSCCRTLLRSLLSRLPKYSRSQIMLVLPQ